MNVSLSGYSLIGNCRSAALVSKYGSIDWCCIPEFHSPAVFAALLDDIKGGFFAIHPLDGFSSTQLYLPDTNVVETRFENEQGNVRVLDAFVAMEEEDKVLTLFPDHEILRIVEGISGTVKMKVEYSPRINYGKHSPGLKNNKKSGVQFSYKENIFILQSTLDETQFEINTESANAEFVIHEGEKVIFSLSSSSQGPAIIPEIRLCGYERMQKTINYWTNWSGKCQYTGFCKELVIRSALTLKLLVHAPTGAIIAAPTTSLPEETGGVRNWDYRYCWLRDASFTVRALIKLGYHEETHVYMNWILHATQLTRPRLQVVYNVFGHSRMKEKVCDWLKGYKNSTPVHIGNAAHDQFQLDVYGEVLDAVYTYSDLVKQFDNDTKKFIIGLGEVICKLWNKPDEGIWEIRSSPVHHTHSKVLAWVGLDRIIKLCRKYNWSNVPIQSFENVQKDIQEQIELKGFNKELNHYTSQFNGHELDAALLILPLVEYCAASSPKMESTRKNIQDLLSEKSFLYRHVNINDGLPGREGAFIVCNFWLVENLVQSGYLDQAIDLFNKTIEYASPGGLLSEEIDPHTNELLGNYPQGFSHIGLINAALSIDEAFKRSKKTT